MTDILILTEQELRNCVTLDSASLDIVDNAFAQLASGDIVMPPVMSMDLPMVNGEVDVKTAYLPNFDIFAIKISPGFFNNPQLGLPSLNGLMVCLCAKTGVVRAVLLDNGYLTDVRTAAAGGVATRHLAPTNVDTLGIIGSGVQARLQAEAFMLARNVKRVLVWSRSRQNAERYAAEQSQTLGVPVQVADSAQQLVEQSQAVITTTPSRQPVISSTSLHPGLHITAMGSDAPDKNELDPAILAMADLLIVDRLQQSLERGELRTAVEQGVPGVDNLARELAAICAGHKSGRQSDQQITVCDLTGTGVQDTAIANYALDTAREKGFGQTIRS